MDKTLEYTVAYRDVKHPRLEYKTGTLLLILPRSTKDEKQTLEKYRKWIQRKELAIRKALEDAQAKNLNINRTDKELKDLVHTLAQKYQAELNTKIDGIHFRKMKTKWASCSGNQNLTVNTLTKHLPQNLIEYIVYHEITHAIERKHNQNFWNHVSRVFPDYETKESELLTYWFIIQRITSNSEQEKIQRNVQTEAQPAENSSIPEGTTPQI